MLKQTTKENIKIGTTLFLVPSSCSSHDKPHDITITKIGRKYAYFGNRDTKIDLATMQVERDYRGIKPELWDSKEAYESSVERSKVISECRSYFTSTDITKRKKLTYKKAVKILAILNDESEVEEKEVTNDQIKELALAYGFKLKEQPNGEMDLNPYVYDFARAIGGNQHPNRKHIKHLIDNLELGKAIILNEQNFKFDNEIALANFKFGIMVADLIYCSDDSAIDRE